MEKNSISRQTIKEWLFSHQPADKNLEELYHLQGRLPQLDELYDNIEEVNSPLKNTGVYLYTDLKCIHPAYRNLKESLRFREEEWFYPFLDISLHRHPRYYPEFRHQHDFFEICYVLSGNCEHSLFWDTHTERVTLAEGGLIIIPPQMEHSIKMISNSVAVNILMRASTFKETFLRNIPADTMLYNYFFGILYTDTPQAFLIFRAENNTILPELFYDIAYEYCNNLPLSSNIMNLKMNLFFAILLRDHYSSMELGGNYRSDGKLAAILQYMELEYANTDINRMAEHFHFNRTYLSRMFKEATGKKLITELQDIRINRAKELLLKTSFSVESIAPMIGYEDPTYFIRLFKKTTGMTPAKFRKINVEQAKDI